MVEDTTTGIFSMRSATPTSWATTMALRTKGEREDQYIFICFSFSWILPLPVAIVFCDGIVADAWTIRNGSRDAEVKSPAV
jgi:hypothetical protein